MDKSGKFKIESTYPNNLSKTIQEFETMQFEAFGNKFVAMKQLSSIAYNRPTINDDFVLYNERKYTTAQANIHIGFDVSTDIAKILNLQATGNIITWTTPLAEIPGNPDETYPVGSIYTTVLPNFNPGTAFGGTWEVRDSSSEIKWLRTA